MFINEQISFKRENWTDGQNYDSLYHANIAASCSKNVVKNLQFSSP